jgi:hypothetical protein
MKPMFKASSETQKLTALFMSLKYGEVLSYARMHKEVGDFSTGSYQTAIRVARRQNVVIATIRGVGCKRLVGSDIVDRQSSHLRGIRRKARIVQKEVETAINENLTTKEQLAATRIHAAAGVILSAANIPRTNTPKVDEPEAVRPR